jgi:hypothetical protein
MQKIPFLIFAGLGILMLGWNLQSAPIFLQDAYQEAIQQQLASNTRTIQDNLHEHPYHDAYIFSENNPLVFAMRDLDTLQTEFEQKINVFIQSNQQKRLSEASINDLDTLLKTYQKSSLDFLKKTFAQPIRGVSPEYCTPAKLDAFANNLDFILDSFEQHWIRKYNIAKKSWFLRPPKRGVMMDWRTLYFSPDYSQKEIQTSLLLAVNSLKNNVFAKKMFLLDKTSKIGFKKHRSYFFIKNLKKKFRKGEKYYPQFIVDLGAPALFKNVQIWVNNQLLMPENYFAFTLVPTQTGYFSYTAKAIIENPYTHKKHSLVDTFYYEVVPKKNKYAE